MQLIASIRKLPEAWQEGGGQRLFARMHTELCQRQTYLAYLVRYRQSLEASLDAQRSLQATCTRSHACVSQVQFFLVC
jgi:hypothetical protein